MKKNCGTGLVPAKSTGTGTSPNSTGTGPEPEFQSGPNIQCIIHPYLYSSIQFQKQYRAFREKQNNTVLGGTVFEGPVLGVLQYIFE